MERLRRGQTPAAGLRGCGALRPATRVGARLGQQCCRLLLLLLLALHLLQLLCGFDLRLLLALLAHLLLKMERNDPVVREGRVCHGRGQQRRASLPPDAGLSPAERAGLARAQHV